MHKIFYKISLFVSLFLFPLSLCDDDIEGHTLFYINHSLEPSDSTPRYTPRGQITYYPSRNEAVYSEEGPLSDSDIAKLKKLAESNDVYRVKILSSPMLFADKNTIFSFTKACAIYESGLSDILSIAVDQDNSPVSIGVSANPPHCSGEEVDDSSLIHFNTTVNVVTLATAPSPDTLTYIQRLDQEKAEKARGEQGDNRSFLSKYWMYIVPFAIFLFISGASGPEGQGGGR